MADAAMLVRRLYEAYQRRDWNACVPLIHPEATYDLPRTDDHVDGGAAILDYQRAYPEPWGELTVLRVVAEGHEAAAEIAVTGGQGGDWRLAAFWTARDGRLQHGVEYWIPLVADGD